MDWVSTNPRERSRPHGCWAHRSRSCHLPSPTSSDCGKWFGITVSRLGIHRLSRYGSCAARRPESLKLLFQATEVTRCSAAMRRIGLMPSQRVRSPGFFALLHGLLPQLLEMIPASDRKVPLRYKATRFLHHAHLPAPARHHRWKMINDVSAVRGLYTPDWLAANPGLGDPERLWWRVFAAAGPTAGPVSRAMLADLGVYLPNDLLVKVDIAGMAHGLEVRVPLLDRRLVEFMAPLPDASKASARRNKILLRASIDNPKLRAAVERPKKGFSVPVSAWLRGELGRLLMDSVRSARFRALGAIDAVGVEAMYRRHMRHEADLSRPLWGMLMLAVWWDGVGETS